MRKTTLSIVLSGAMLAVAALATPAMADEARIEADGGIVFDHAHSEATAGVVGGYDFDLGKTAFVGVEARADKILARDNRVQWGGGGRIGVKTATGGKLYALADYETKTCRYCEHSVTVGGGFQQDLGKRYYAKLEYRHALLDNGVPDTDSVLTGVGVKF